MKNIKSWSQAAALALSLALCMGACQQQKDESTNTAKTENAPVVSAPRETPLQKQTPTPTPAPIERKDVRITGLMIGTNLDAHNEITNPGSKYHVGDSIHALVRTNGRGPEATIKLRCNDEAGNVVYEESKKIAPTGEAALVFTLAAAKGFSKGEYHLTGLLDDYPEMAVSFAVSE